MPVLQNTSFSPGGKAAFLWQTFLHMFTGTPASGFSVLLWSRFVHYQIILLEKHQCICSFGPEMSEQRP